MPRKITPTASQKRSFYIHCVVFAIATAAMFFIHHMQQAEHWAYPWHAWVIAAWALALLGHGCAVFASYSDHGMEEYQRQSANG